MQDRLNSSGPVIVSNAIKAAQELASKNPDADFAPLIAALERLTAADDETLRKARIPAGRGAKGADGAQGAACALVASKLRVAGVEASRDPSN